MQVGVLQAVLDVPGPRPARPSPATAGDRTQVHGAGSEVEPVYHMDRARSERLPRCALAWQDQLALGIAARRLYALHGFRGELN